MSVTIDIENFQSWSEIFMEIKRQNNLKTFMFIESGNTIAHHQERKPRSFSLMEVKRTKFYKQGDGLDSKQSEIDQRSFQAQQLRRRRYASTPSPRIPDPDNLYQNDDQAGPNRWSKDLLHLQPPIRIKSTPSPTRSVAQDDLVRRDSRLTDAARKLSKQEMALLYEDVLKPLDVFSILLERRKQTEESNELF